MSKPEAWICDCRHDPKHIPSECATGRVYVAPKEKPKHTHPGGGVPEEAPFRIYTEIRLDDQRVPSALHRVHTLAEANGWSCRITYAEGANEPGGRWVRSVALRLRKNQFAGVAVWEAGKRIVNIIAIRGWMRKVSAKEFGEILKK
jgi:hypothetical protein